MHGAKAAALSHPWRDHTLVTALAAKRELHLTVPLAPSVVRVTFPVPNRIRRDAHNYTGTMVKACLDGAVRAGLWGDDTPEWITVVDPRLVLIEGLDDPTTGLAARAHALIDIVPRSILMAALVGHPELADLFKTEDDE